MNRFRVLLSLLLGLSLMTQGMFVATALASDAMKAPVTASSMKMDMSADMPCMDMMDMDGDQAPPSKCPFKCCDGKICLDMSHCAQAQPAMTTAAATTVYAEIEHHAPAVQAPIAAVRPPTSLLRPPISLHS